MPLADDHYPAGTLHSLDDPGCASCCENGFCNCLGYWCFPCCYHCMLAGELEQSSCCNRCLVGWCCLPLLIMVNRIRVTERMQPKVVESACHLACCSCCCMPCFSCQTLIAAYKVPGLEPWEMSACCEKERAGSNEPVQQGNKDQ
eukprot:Hpha_TRINITY_DN14947_c0_g1::TRINITY_DN14947_c0_g1_i2::g.144482::m.144482